MICGHYVNSTHCEGENVGNELCSKLSSNTELSCSKLSRSAELSHSKLSNSMALSRVKWFGVRN